MTIDRRQLADAVLAASHIAERQAIAAFVADAATQPAPNPFPQTSVGTVRQVWRQRGVEFQSFDIAALGLADLLAALSGRGVGEALVQVILRAGSCTANVFLYGDGCRIVGAVLYGKARGALPLFAVPSEARPPTRVRVRTSSGQLDLFT